MGNKRWLTKLHVDQRVHVAGDTTSNGIPGLINHQRESLPVWVKHQHPWELHAHHTHFLCVVSTSSQCHPLVIRGTTPQALQLRQHPASRHTWEVLLLKGELTTRTGVFLRLKPIGDLLLYPRWGHWPCSFPCLK